MENINNTKRELINKAACLIFILAAASMLLISVTVYGAPAGQLLTLLLFFVFYVQLPGMLIAKWAGLDRSHISLYLLTGTFAGWAAEVAVYFITDCIGSNILLAGCGPLLSAAFIFVTIRSRRSGGRLLYQRLRPGRIQAAFCVFMTIMLFYCMINTQFRYLAPELSDYIYLNPDKAYHIGIINSLTHGYPVESPWIHGRFMKYHVFTEMLFSIPVSLFGVRADVVTISFGPLLTAWCFGGSLYAFFRVMMGRKDRAGLYSLVFMLSMPYIARRWTSSFGNKLILTNDNFAGYALAAMLVFIALLSLWYGEFDAHDRRHLRKLVLMLLLMMLITGIKGPVGAVMVAALWGTVVLGLILRKMPFKAVIPLIALTAAFVLIYVTVLGAKGQVGSAGGATIKLASIIDISFWKEPLTAFLKAHGIPKSARLAIIFAVFWLSFFTVYAFPLIIGYLRELVIVISGKKGFRPADVLIYAVTLVGFAAMMLLSFSGHSQVYFGLTALVLAPVISYRFIEDLETDPEAGKHAADKRSHSPLLSITIAVMTLTLAASCCLMCSYFSRRISEAKSYAKSSEEESHYMSMSRGEYEAMRWIDENTEKDALLANDRYYSCSPKKYSYENRWANRFFLYEVYANRLSYISGSGFDMAGTEALLRREMIVRDRSLIDETNAERGDLARELGIDYVILSKRFSGDRDLANEDYEEVFENEDVKVYKVKY